MPFEKNKFFKIYLDASLERGKENTKITKGLETVIKTPLKCLIIFLSLNNLLMIIVN